MIADLTCRALFRLSERLDVAVSKRPAGRLRDLLWATQEGVRKGWLYVMKHNPDGRAVLDMKREIWATRDELSKICPAMSDDALTLGAMKLWGMAQRRGDRDHTGYQVALQSLLHGPDGLGDIRGLSPEDVAQRIWWAAAHGGGGEP